MTAWILASTQTPVPVEVTVQSGGVATLVMSIVALVVSLLLALITYFYSERRHRTEIIGNALTDLTTGELADTRDNFSAFLDFPRSPSIANYSLAESPLEFPGHKYGPSFVRSSYFELCWAYQRGSVARSLSGKLVRGHGVHQLDFHLKALARQIRTFHNSFDALELNHQKSKKAYLNDDDIWRTIGSDILLDAPGAPKKPSIDFLAYFRIYLTGAN